jgi:fatty-acyl-CoA synthase
VDSNSPDTGARLSYARGDSDAPLLSGTLAAWVDQAAARWGERDALISRHQDLRYTYRRLRDAVDRVAESLMALGVAPGDRVGIWGRSCVEWTLTQYATAKIGAILVTISPSYRVPEIEHVLRHSGVSVLVASHRESWNQAATMLRQLRRGVGSPGKESTGSLSSLREVVLAAPEFEPGTLSWEAFIDAGLRLGVSSTRDRPSPCQDDAAAILYTSGTTGVPKGATLSHRAILNTGFAVGERLGYGPSDRICLPMPLYHVFGCVLGNVAALTHGSAVVLPSETFEPKACLEAIHAEACTTIYGVPTMFLAQLQHPEFSRYRLTSLRAGLIGGAPCSATLMPQIIEGMHVAELATTYGMTETPPVLQSPPTDSIEDRVSTAGTVLPHVECKIVDAHGHITSRGTPGELCVRGYGVMLGYWEDSRATSLAIDAEGWMHTGDLAVMREDGHVTVIGRAKEMILRGGENVYPREVEEVLLRHPHVRSAHVVGVPDTDYGEEVCAWIQLHEGHTATDQEIRKFCRHHVSPSRIPRYIRFTDTFPMTATGKVQKFRMRQISIDELQLADSEQASIGSVERI